MKIPELISHYVSISNSASAIGFEAVFQPDYPVEGWSEMFKSLNLGDQRQQSLIRLVDRV